MTLFDSLAPRPADALLGLMAAFRADPRETKIDLGVGVYRTDNGETPILKAVREAEIRLAEKGTTKVYEGPRGNVVFAEHVERLVYGTVPSHVTSFAAPGGCGALYLAMSLVQRTTPSATMWVSAPTWANHPHIAKTAGLSVASYPYASPSDPGVDGDAMVEGLQKARPGDGVVIQGACHNPTGIDLTKDQWIKVGKAVADLGLIPIVDIAYHGFAVSLDEDIAGVRAFLAEVPNALVSYSCSKNFGLYRERSGCLVVQTTSDAALASIHSHLADISRGSYSMPPAHGPAIVAEILGTDELLAMWQEELAEMRGRVNTLRANLAAALKPRSNSYDPSVLTQQTGMFSQLPFVEGGVDALRERGLYIPGSGRLNIAGLSSLVVDRVGEEMSAFL